MPGVRELAENGPSLGRLLQPTAKARPRSLSHDWQASQRAERL